MSGRIVYGWAPGRATADLDPQKVGDELERIRGRAGELTPTLVLDAARRKRSPLHPWFEWDDGSAAEKYRLWQARHLVTSVIVERVDEMESLPVRAFVSVSREGSSTREYIPTLDAREDPFFRKQVLDRALDEALKWRRRYEDLAEFAGVVAAIDETAEALRIAS